MNALLLLLALVPSAPDRIQTEVEAEVDESLETVRLSVRTHFTAGEALEELRVLLPADRFLAPPEMQATQIRQIYPARFSPGGFLDPKVEIDGRACVAADAGASGEGVRRCPVTLAAGQSATVRTEALLVVPDRFGPFGHRGHALTLLGGWLPVVLRTGAPPLRGSFHLSVTAPAELSALIGDRWFPARDGPSPRVLEASFESVAQPSLLLRPGSDRALSAAGGQARYVIGPASQVVAPEDRPVEVEQVLKTLDDGLRFLEEEGFPPPSKPLLVVDAPLRHELAQAGEQLVLVSDRAFRIFPIDRFLRFHRFPILREVFLTRFLALLDEAPVDRVLAADAIASWLLDRYVASRFGRAENAFDVIGAFGFIPAIDSMLYAPDLAFVGAYFRLIKEEDPLRDDFLDFGSPMAAEHPLPRGKILYEKLVDQLGLTAASEVFRRIALGRTRLFPALGEALGDRAAPFLKTWLGPYPETRYSLERFDSKKNGACSGCSEVRVEIRREGAEVEEPVEVLLRDDDGGERLVTAPASNKPLRILTATLAAPLSKVELDPFGRLAESPISGNPSPHYLHDSKPTWKLLLNNFNVLYSHTSSSTIDTAIDIGFSRAYDVHWAYALRFDYAPEAISLSGRARYGFGELVTAARLSQWLTLTVEGDYLRSGFAAEKLSGLATELALTYGYDDRTSLWAPEAGTAFAITADYSHVFGALPGDQTLTRDTFQLTARGVRQWMLGLGQTFSVRASAGAFLFGEPRAQLKYGLGGRYNVRGYALDASVGKMRALASAEWTHPILSDWSFNGLWFVWFNGLDGALFGDLAVIGDSVDQIEHRRALSDVGYGLRFYIDYFGVRPGVMAIDFALPLVPVAGTMKLGPPTFYVDFSQSFAAF